jgi:hypothetical protein
MGRARLIGARFSGQKHGQGGAYSDGWSPYSCSSVESRHGDVLFSVSVTRVNSTNVLNKGLRIGEIGRRMNSKVKLVEIGVYRK